MTLTNFVIALALFSFPAFAQHGESAKPAADAGATAAAAKSADAKSAEAKPAEAVKNPLPADKSAPQTITVKGKTLHYTATVGTITLKTAKGDEAKGKNDESKGKNRDSAKDSDGASHRPVTFALNGGPGASSV